MLAEGQGDVRGVPEVKREKAELASAKIDTQHASPKKSWDKTASERGT